MRLRRRAITRWGLGLSAVLLVTVPLGLASVRSDEPLPSDMVVHEWGTFLAMNGSDGVNLEGMYHEEHALPGFVHARSRDQLRLPSIDLKGETPVIYFYTQNRQKATVSVGFPEGIWTQWYPQADLVAPSFGAIPKASDLKNGRIRWNVEVIPSGNEPIPVPETSSDALWNFAREVDAAYVRTKDYSVDPEREDTERFLFYRGLGRSKLPLKFSADAGGTIALDKSDRFGLAHVFVLRVEGDKATYSYRKGLNPGESVTHAIPSLDRARPVETFANELADDLAKRLVESGLYPKEARAMVNTWRSSYFTTPGVRVLFVLPQAWTDAFIPLTITPKPKTTVRVMVGRTELLTPDRERLAEAAIRDLASPDAKAREKAFKTLQDQGRYVEPIVRRVLYSSADPSVKMLCKQLLNAEFVTELRAALHDADGRRAHIEENPSHVQAQLASLLREIGRVDEAKVEAKMALGGLEQGHKPDITHMAYRGYARANLRANEAIGNVAGSAEWADRFVAFGSQSITRNECRGCHRAAGPMSASWFRTWWAGPRYAENVAKTEGIDKAIARLEESHTAADRLRLAYLLDARGDKPRAESIWKELEKSAPGGAISSAR